MAEYIDKAEALDALRDEMAGTGYQSRAMMAIERIHPADVAPVVHACWEWDPISRDESELRCGHCHEGKWCSPELPRCPHCGAIMDRQNERNAAVNDEAAEANPEPEKKPPFNPGDLVRSPCPMGGTGKTFSVVECYEVEDAPAGVTIWHLDLRADDGRILTALPASLYMMVKPHRETFRERVAREHPEALGPDYLGGVAYCPDYYGYENHSPCLFRYDPEDGDESCRECWDREIPEGVTDDA